MLIQFHSAAKAEQKDLSSSRSPLTACTFFFTINLTDSQKRRPILSSWYGENQKQPFAFLETAKRYGCLFFILLSALNLYHVFSIREKKSDLVKEHMNK